MASTYTEVRQEPEVIEAEFAKGVTDADFRVAPHECEWLYVGVCSVCGVIGIWSTDKVGNFQDPFPGFGSDEYLTW